MTGSFIGHHVRQGSWPMSLQGISAWDYRHSTLQLALRGILGYELIVITVSCQVLYPLSYVPSSLPPCLLRMGLSLNSQTLAWFKVNSESQRPVYLHFSSLFFFFNQTKPNGKIAFREWIQALVLTAEVLYKWTTNPTQFWSFTTMFPSVRMNWGPSALDWLPVLIAPRDLPPGSTFSKFYRLTSPHQGSRSEHRMLCQTLKPQSECSREYAERIFILPPLLVLGNSQELGKQKAGMNRTIDKREKLGMRDSQENGRRVDRETQTLWYFPSGKLTITDLNSAAI